MLLAGDGPLREELEALARSVSPDGRIKFLGHVSDVRAVLHAADIYALPSEEEAFGLALVEAMACELVCVATRSTGPREIIENGKTGFLVDKSDEGLLEGLRKALALSPAERESMTAAARQKTIETFDAHRALAQRLACLEIDQAGQNVA
jgi:glycosyltransferase involved in cell wall biosynthesis